MDIKIIAYMYYVCYQPSMEKYVRLFQFMKCMQGDAKHTLITRQILADSQQQT